MLTVDCGIFITSGGTPGLFEYHWLMVIKIYEPKVL